MAYPRMVVRFHLFLVSARDKNLDFIHNFCDDINNALAPKHEQPERSQRNAVVYCGGLY